MSLGTEPGTNPVSGAATWRGAAVGFEFLPGGPGDAIAGDAALRVDFGRATLDLELTGLAGAAGTTGVRRPDIVWREVPMVRRAFRANGLDGRFYGTNHQEAGGVFERNRIAGGFLVRR